MLNDNRPPENECLAIPALAKEQRLMRKQLERRGALHRFHQHAGPLEQRLFSSAHNLYVFFHDNGYKITKGDWDAGAINASFLRYRGWVYAFYGDEELPIYVGETGRTLKHRFFEHKKRANWWEHWAGVKVLPCPNQSIRKYFEALIGLAGGYNANKQQPVGPDNIFDDILLSLLLIGNDKERPPIFPTLDD